MVEVSKVDNSSILKELPLGCRFGCETLQVNDEALLWMVWLKLLLPSLFIGGFHQTLLFFQG